MSIEIKLINGADSVSIRRKTYDKETKKLSTENLGQYKLEDVESIQGLTSEEHESVKLFATEQSDQIQQALALNAMQGVFGGLPVVSKGKFTGEIKGARAVHLKNRKGFNSSSIEEIVHKEQMANMAFEILNNETKAIKSRIEENPELRGFELISEDRAVQYMTLGEVLVKLSKTAMGQRYRKLKEDHVDFILEQIDELIEQIPALANLGKRSRGSDGDLRVNRIRRRKENQTMDERHEARLKQEAEQQQTIDEVKSEYGTTEDKAKNHINEKLNGKSVVQHLTMLTSNEMSAEEHI